MVRTVMEQWQTQTLRVEGRTISRETLREAAAGEVRSEMRDLYDFLERWFSPRPTMELLTSGSTGEAKRITARKEQMMAGAEMTCRRLGLGAADGALLCMNLRYIGAMMVVVRALVGGMELWVRPASGHPLADPLPEGAEVAFAAMVPLQVANTLGVDAERERLERIREVIIGGGAVDARLAARIAGMANGVWSTYGMTETLSHIALRRLSGESRSERYTPLEGVSLARSEEGTLVIDAPRVCDTRLVTHDLVELFADGSFVILGRLDNVINSGGVKIRIEEVEEALRGVVECGFAVTALPDGKLGEEVTLLVDADIDPRGVVSACAALPRYHAPRRIVRVERIPLTPNGKIDRRACREAAKEGWRIV